MPECIKEVIADLRAIIISCKNGLQINDIEDDYRETFGQDIPLKDLGYKTLQEFFINYPEDFTLHGKTVRAVAKASSEHIVSLIRKQRKEKYKKSRQSPPKRKENGQKQKREGVTPKQIKNLNSVQRRVAKHRSLSNFSNNSFNSLRITVDNNKKYNSVNVTQGGVPKELKLNYQTKLMNFCADSRLILPTYSVLERQYVNGTSGYTCCVSLGGIYKVSSQPFEVDTEFAAMELAAKRAYYDLINTKNLTFLIGETKYIDRLRDVCNVYNLPQPFFRFIESHPTTDRVYYTCNLEIGDMLFSSSPVEALDVEIARDLAAMKAWDHIRCHSLRTCI